MPCRDHASTMQVRDVHYHQQETATRPWNTIDAVEMVHDSKDCSSNSGWFDVWGLSCPDFFILLFGVKIIPGFSTSPWLQYMENIIFWVSVDVDTVCGLLLQHWQWWELLEKEVTCISAPVSNKKQKFSASEKRNSTGTSLLHRKKTVLLFFREKKQYFPSSQKRSSTYLFQRKEAALLRFKEKKQHFSSSEKRSSTSPLQRKEAARIFFWEKKQHFSGLEKRSSTSPLQRKEVAFIFFREKNQYFPSSLKYCKAKLYFF